MNKIIKNTVILTLITVIAGLGLGYVYEITKDPIAQAQEALKAAGRNVLFVASVCGTYEDFQGYDAQKKLLEQQGVIVLESNAQAADLAIQIVR
jgi:electron transport complex protein RnfG